MNHDKCSEDTPKNVLIRCPEDQNEHTQIAGGSNIVCKFPLARLAEDCVFCADELDTFSQQSWSYEDKQQLLNKLGELMLDYKKGLCIAKHFRGILLEILKRTQGWVRGNIERKKLNHIRFSLTLSHLLPMFPYILSFVLKYFQENGPFFRQGMKSEDYTLVVETAYRFLSFSPTTFRGLWNWGILCQVNYLESDKTKWFFVMAMSIVLNCNNIEKIELSKICDSSTISQTKALEELCYQVKTVDETQNENDVFNEIVFTENDLCEEHMIIANMLIPRISKTSLSSQELVAVPSMLRNVEAISIAFVSGKAVLVCGAVGSGKTSLVEHFATLTGRDKLPCMYKVQLGDQTDSKALIGSYCCSDVPGEFVWRPGILTRAVREGRWLLLEDIDCAPMDVISVLIPVLESRVLSIPGKENIQAAPGFRLFATQRIGQFSRRSNSECSLLEHLWSKVSIEPLTKYELEEIVVAKFPNLKPLANKLVDTFSLLSSDLQINSKPDTRIVNLSADKRLSTVRDFMKWCRRLSALTNTGPTLLSSQDIFQEAMDCFCATISNLENRMSMALAIGAKLNLNKAKVEHVCSTYKPAVNLAPLCFTVGRITLNREQDGEQIEKPNFAFTRHSLALLESLAVCVSQNEPMLLVGETGTGKTSAIQYLASLCNRALVVVNMSQQSDSTDLIGGFKPMEMKQLIAPVREEFEALFCRTFSRKQNVKFLTNVQQCFGQRKWEVLFKMMMHTQQAALERLSKDTSTSDKNLLSLWKKVGQRVQHLRQQLKHVESAQMFSFVEGALVKAIKQGDWVLLDEINLATPETLECLNGILESQQGSVVVLERGDAEPIIRHEQFRMFACMNPANDVGKKELPAGIRNRFTEIFVSELQDIPDLNTLVFSYLQGLSPPVPLINGIVSFYLLIREESAQKLTDGSGNRPYYSLRTLCRALKYASRNLHGNILRSVYEGFCISFLTQLDRSSHNIVETLLQEKLLGHVNARSLVNQPLRKPDLKNEKFLNFEGYWICEGNLEPTRSSEYVFTSTVKDNLKCLARIVSGRDFPVLIQGETSVGKTSLINWLAKTSGNYCVRINNHEHTDIQEYLGCYTSDASGKLVFKEGILVDAMRKGYWIILDELNLAPTDVLEALNRLLDDNRELFIPEIQETVKAHQKFMLFATQNPPGHYGGRKVLSRAFRNRFVELHFEELPSKELETILHKRCNLPMSYSKTLVNIMLELQVRRRGSTVFRGKQGFITLRDLFRWADRYSKSQDSEGTFFDWNQQLAEDGYLLLAGRCRNAQETLVVQEVIEKNTKRTINVDCLFGHPSKTNLSSFSEKILKELINNCPEEFGHVVFTYNMRRLAVLIARALQFNEPVLLVGETGCGKTTICQVFAAVQKKKLYAVNCHLHTETSDFLGGLRPARREKNADKDTPMRLFEWCDGSLVNAMKEGCMFLADEISLADDSVLERLNSVLEPERTLIMAEKGSSSDSEFQQDIDLIVAENGFQLLATMNPGGDYGKKELSPALRNRFTEIWCPANDEAADTIDIIEHNLSPGIPLKPQPDGSSGIGRAMIEFIQWFKQSNFAKRCIVTVRDYLSWVQFINVCSSTNSTDQHTLLEPSQAYFHGAFLVFLDALGLGRMINSQSTNSAREFLLNQVKGFDDHNNATIKAMETENDNNNEMFTFGGFSIARGPELSPNIHNQYALNATTTSGNAERVMRAMQLDRPILLEGSPGVGKTSLVSALAKASGHRLVRINLSEQTDISDLFGADLPVESNQGCQFSWCDGPLLLALKSGSWIVLDELNLASQSVLEGLNACFDHRGEIFIPELGMSFQVQRGRTKFFACQNPLNQGGGRKGLPKSFLNRFTQVYVEPLTHDDLSFITRSMYPTIKRNILEGMITFNDKVYQHCVVEGLCSKHGWSWEFNLRDIFRWCDLMVECQGDSHWNPAAFVQMIYVGRMRTDVCRNQVWELCSSVFSVNSTKDVATLVHATPSHIQVGQCLFPKCESHTQSGTVQTDPLYILHRTLKPLESLLTCLKMNWLAILVGPKSSSKTSLARLAAQLTGTKLDEMAMNSSIDTTELLGGYEQADLERQWTDIKEKVMEEIFRLCRSLLLSKNFDSIKYILGQWFSFCKGDVTKGLPDESVNPHSSDILNDIALLSEVIDEMIKVCHGHDLKDFNFERLKVLVTELHDDLIERNGNSHVSGQFEWVDGQLVKALKNGHWLLIDNVNFCSPSVLDRLNGLLEPGGVLSINERGVIDGEIPVVKPHPDFRLIFAMDSRHGEISRAMRNRGVEIFMMQEDCDTDDLCSMLYASGCRNSTAIQTLSNFHDQNKKGSLLQTIHTGSLMSELWQRGIELEKSLVMSMNHVYGQMCDLPQFMTEEQLVLEPSKLLKHKLKPTATSFQKDAIHAMITWHATPLEILIEDISKSPLRDVRIVINIFLEWCSKEDWRTRLDWLKSSLLPSRIGSDRFTSESEIADYCLQKLFESKVVKLLYDIYGKLEMNYIDCKFDASYQPVNVRVNGPLYKYISCKIHWDEEMSGQFTSYINRVYLLWTFLALEGEAKFYLNSVDKVQLNTPLKLSFAYMKGDMRSDMSSESLPHKGIAHIFPLLHSFQECMRYLLESSNLDFKDNVAYEIWVSLRQYKQFFDACTRCYSQDENYHVLFDIRWKFFSNGALGTICKFFNEHCCEISALGKLLSVKKCLDEMCSRDNELALCRWKMIHDFEHPSVFVFEEMCLLWAKLTKLYADLADHNPAMKLQVEGTVNQTRTWKVALLKGMVSLIKLREGKVRQEDAKNCLARITESVKKIEQERCCDEIMDQSSSDVLAQFSEIFIHNKGDEHSENLNEVYGSEIIQGYCSVVANCAYAECINFLKLISLRKKILNETSLPNSDVKWNQRLMGYYDFCVKYLREIPLNTAVIQYILHCGQDEHGYLSVLKIADDNIFCNLTEKQYQERIVESNVSCPLPNNSCFVKTFEALSVIPTQQYSTTDKKQGQVRLVDVNEKILEYNHLNTFLWLHKNRFANLDSTRLSISRKSFMLAFIRLIHCSNSITEIQDCHSMYSDFLSFSKFEKETLEKHIDNIKGRYGRLDESLEDLFVQIRKHLGLIVNTDVLTDCWDKLGRCWVYLGMIQSKLLRPVGNVDPVEETNVKVDSIKSEIKDLNCELKVRLQNEELLTGIDKKRSQVNESIDVDSVSDSVSATLQINQSHVENLVKYRTSLKDKLSKVGDNIAYRPAPSQFRKIIGILGHFYATVGLPDVLLDERNVESKIKSIRKLILQLQDFVAYQDLLAPYISGLIQIVQELKMRKSVKNSSLEGIEGRQRDAETCLRRQIVSCLLPFSCSENSLMSTRIGDLLKEGLSRGIEVLCQSCPSILIDCKEASEKLKFRIRMLALNVLKRSVCRTGYTNSDDMKHLKIVINCYKTLWLQREEERNLQEEEGESLYKFKTKTYCSDEESEEQKTEKEIDELFTKFDQEYKDLHMDKTQRGSRSEKKQQSNQSQANFDTILESDMAQFCKIYQFLVSSVPNVSQVLATWDNAEWKQVDKRLEDVKIALESYSIASEVINLADLCDGDLLDVDTTPSHLVMSSFLSKFLSSCQSESALEDQTDVCSASLLFGRRSEEYDIYHDSNLKEIIQVLPILTSFKSRLQELLEKWPEHPTLVQLCQTIDRIISFPVTSSVMKILNGLEILLKYSQEWESNASRHVSISIYLDQITHMIIRWRKLELSCWSSLLHVCEMKTREKANHWWFHIHHVIQQYSVPKDGESTDFTELIKVLQQFMECSSLGQFSERLKILASFSYQETIDSAQNDDSGIVGIVLWNVYCYYKQFESRVGSLIQKAKAPIEKELKDFIRIVKWKDINYWAMKETSTKSHYTLLKLMKKYQAELSEGIDGILSSTGQVGSPEDPTKQDDSCYKLEPNTFLSPIQNLDLEGAGSELFSKMKKLTEQKLNVLRYEVLSASVNTFTGEVVSTTHSLQNLEIGNKTGKERTQFRKHIYTLKKRALADLFKGLRKMGLSYRKGISLRQKNYLKDPMMVNCSNVLRILRNMDILFMNNENSNLLPMLENSMEYYQKCVARSAILNNVLTSPYKDLTVGDVDRIKGFAEHLRQITQRQRESISTVGKLLSELRLVTRQLKNLSTSRPYRLPPQHDVADWTLKLHKLLNSGLETSENLLCFLETCPESKIDLTMSPISEQLSDLSKCCKQDTVYFRLQKDIETFHDEISKIKSKVDLQTLLLNPDSNTKEKEGSGFIATWFHFECLGESFKQLERTLLYLEEFVKMDTSDFGFGKLAFDLRQEITDTCNKFTSWNKETFKEAQNGTSEERFSSLRSKVASTRESIRLSFQKWYKRRENEIDEAKESIVREEVEDDKYFVEGLDNELQADISILNIQERTKDIKSFIKFFRQAIDGQYKKYNNITSIERLCEIMVSILPCLSQYVLLIEYHFHQLLLCHRSSCKLHSVLLGIFSELLQKGFCIPADEEEMEGEGATSFEDAENCGIGEGEGRKDVSKQIENEEQLLGGEQAESEKKEDNNPIADEEHGIEMSEDFEGETHDVEKSGESSDEEDESGDESENLEQKMGDVDGADETLDEKLWADSDEEDDNDEKDDVDERGAGAEGEGQSEMVAKEENQGSSKERKSKPKTDKMEEDEINELGKDEDDIGNLDDNFTDNKNKMNPDDPQPEDIKLPEDLELDTQGSDDDGNDDGGDGGGDDDAGDVMDDTAGKVGDANNSDDESGLQVIEDQESVEETNKEDETNENQDEADLDKEEEEEGDDNVKENEWKTESETKGENVESIEDQGNPDASSSGLSAGNERFEPTDNDESNREEDNEGTGNSISQQSGLNSTDCSTADKSTDLPSNDTRSYRKELNKSRADRSLGSSEETAYKKPKILDSEDGPKNSQPQDTSSAELFEHIRNESEMHDIQVYDAATEQQIQQEAFHYPTETDAQHETEDMDEDWELPPGENSRIADVKEEESERGLRFKPDKTQSSPQKETNDDDEMSTEDQDEFGKEWQDTTTSVFMGNNPSSVGGVEDTEALDPERCRSELEELLCKWRDLEKGSPEEQATALDAWHKYEQLTSAHSQQLCEQLRIVLEPSVANKLKGDYRTGKRLNMRKVIPYIASQYRKDKIWLRRTKKSKRQYQILLAIDDSSSMSDNESKQLAFESLAIITNALTRLEAGEIAICSFGEDVQLLHPFHETFTEQSGANILRQFRFEQKKTKIAQGLDACTSVMTSARSRVNIGNDVSQLLLIVSDGRGIFLEGIETVQRAVRKAREAGIFLVFVVLDNPTNKDSILDIKSPIFRPGQMPELKSYIEQFPFPFYIILRDISSLPETLSDSLRQWFELVTNMS